MRPVDCVFRRDGVDRDHVVERDEDISVQLQMAAGSVRRSPVGIRAMTWPYSNLLAPGWWLRRPQPLPPNRPAGSGARAPSQEGIQASLGVVSAVGGPVRTGSGGLLENTCAPMPSLPGFSVGRWSMPLAGCWVEHFRPGARCLTHHSSLACLAGGRSSCSARLRAPWLPGYPQPTGID